MTVIAWDGKTLAADKRASNGWCTHDTVTKIFNHNGKLIAFCGVSAKSLQLVEWFKAGAIQSEFPRQVAESEDSGNLIIIENKGVFQYSTGPYPTRIENEFCAWGSGTDVALAAMHCGKNSREAVELACLLTPGCGNGIDTLDFGDDINR